MSAENDGGPAFPINVPATEYHEAKSYSGMTLRDWFAGQALAAFISQSAALGYLKEFEGRETDHDKWGAARSYEIADAMLSARTPKKDLP